MSMYPNLWKVLSAKADCYRDKPVATFGKKRLSFEDLTRDIRILAGYFKTCTDKTVIGINLSDPLESITSILAALVAGKAFWPTSDQLIEKVEKDTRAHVFILDDALFKKGLVTSKAYFEYEEYVKADRPFCWATSSGSMASSKVTEHSYYSLMEDTFRQIKTHKIGIDDKIDVISSLSFSASLSSLFPALFSGASLHFYDRGSSDITGVFRFWQEERITMSTMIPTVFRALLQHEFDFKTLDIRFICIGGESVLLSDIALFQKKLPVNSLLQLSLASSETRGTAEYITTTTAPLPEEYILYEPIEAKKLSIVDEKGRLVNDGQSGQIAITSKVIGSKYVQGPENFKKSPEGLRTFISDDIGSIHDNRLRVEDRVNRVFKHKGEFIDLDKTTREVLDIEGVLNCYMGLQDEKTLLYIAVYSLMEKSVIRKAITKQLGTSAFKLYLMATPLPKTHSGKLDLPLLNSLLLTESPTDYTDEEIRYQQQWKHVFPEESAFEGKHFFTDLGGDSLSATKLTVRLCKTFGLVFEPNVIYLHPRYEELYHYIKNAEPFMLKLVGEFKSSKENILFFPTIYGKHEQYLAIIGHLQHKYNFFLIQYTTMSGRNYECPKDIAKKCADLLNESEHNFTCLAGFSFSGYLAYWTAHYLNQNSGLILLDSHTYRKFGNTKKRLLDTLYYGQRLFQKVKRPTHLKKTIIKRLERSADSNASRLPDENKISVKRSYNNFFQAFLQNPLELPSTSFPMGVFKAKNYSDIRYVFSYDFNWGKHNSNIQFTRLLEGNHSDFWRREQNSKAIAREIDEFIEAYCD